MSKRVEDAFFKKVTAAKTDFPVGVEALYEAAQKKFEKNPFGYIYSGASGEETLRNNRRAFERWAIVPRFLTDVSEVDTSVTLFGKTYDTPILFAPVGMQKLAHEEAELASSRAAAKFGIPFIQSTVSSYSIESIQEATNDSPKWFQLYWSTVDEDLPKSMVQRAERAGYEAIVLTIDTVRIGWRETDLRNQFSPLKGGLGKANYVEDPVFQRSLRDDSDEALIDVLVQHVHHPTLGWEQIEKLQSWTKLPIVLKGILHPEDAKEAVARGIDGIVVSNHGGRQLDGVIASLDALPAVAEAVDGRIPVLFDSGIRSGVDVVKALALGADAVCVGRPYIYALGIDGERGVTTWVEHLLEEMTASIALAGANSVKQVRHLTLVENK